ncbi:MAG TPA: glycosyltransferase, partial [Candidatus Binatia bacterium]|nr:glycosyltransferase [Candidatus Binatia bacterium]
MNVSVIIPVLNEEKTIGATLGELITLQPYEIIVVDGGSRDRSREICQQFGVELLNSERGRARQMNNGARRATGDALLFLHADTKLPASALRDIASV